MTASAVASVVADGPAAGCRALDLRVERGLDLRLLPDRGLDVGAAWYRGVQLAWISAVGETAPLPSPRELDWLDAFGGGLVTTCGLRNVGAPSEGHGLHGTFSHLRARDVRWAREGAWVLAAGTILDASAIGHRLELRRTIRTRVGEGRVELEDVTRNLGPDPEAAPLLYHVNLGPPLWSEGARLELEADAIVPRDGDAAAGLATWNETPALEPGARERVFEHVGAGTAAVVNEELALRLEVRSSLPRLHQWTHPGYGALGIEPANCSVLGRAADRAAGRLPELAPGEERVTRLEILVGSLR